MGNIYRKASMDRLASPEQLDKMIRIASPSLWIAVAGAGLVVVSVLLWAIFGRLPDNVTISGLYMSNTDVQSAYATYGGKVSELYVEKDQQVEAGDVVAVVINEDSEEAIAQLQKRKDMVEAVTLTSKNDISSSDNSKLLEYKLQYQTSGMTLEQRQQTLEALKKQLEEVKAQVSTYKANMDAAENAYLAAIGDDGINSASFRYQTAQAEYQLAQSDYQTAYASVSSLESSYATAEQSLQNLSQQYSSLEEQYRTLKTSYDSQLAEISEYQGQYDALVSEYQGQEIPVEVQQQLNSLNNAIAALRTSSDSLAAQISSVNDGMTELEISIQEQGAQVSALNAQLSKAQGELKSAQSRLSSAEAAYQSAQSTYGSHYSSQNQKTANSTRLQTAFSEASTLYSNAYSQQQSIEQQIREMSLETGFEVNNEAVNKDTLREQFKSTKEAILQDLEREMDNMRTNGAIEEVKAQVSGTVVDCAVQLNQLVGQGTTIAKIKSAENEDENENAQIVRCYVPIANGKKLMPGMEVVVTPSTVNEQEYGHMMAVVESVGIYTVTTAEMQQVLGDDSMVQANQQQGPCVEVLVSLEKDEDTVSGYAWSNRKGETIAIGENTPITAKVRVKESAPISKLIPFLKSKMDVQVDTQTTAN